MGGRPYQAGKFAKSLRIRCMKEHLGLLPNERRPAKFPYDVTCDDPVADDFFVDIWQSTAKLNTRIYEEVRRIVCYLFILFITGVPSLSNG